MFRSKISSRDRDGCVWRRTPYHTNDTSCSDEHLWYACMVTFGQLFPTELALHLRSPDLGLASWGWFVELTALTVILLDMATHVGGGDHHIALLTLALLSCLGFHLRCWRSHKLNIIVLIVSLNISDLADAILVALWYMVPLSREAFPNMTPPF